MLCHGRESNDSRGRWNQSGRRSRRSHGAGPEERTVEAPPELKKELAKSKKAQERWEKLSFTHKKEMARSITEAKQEETKKRRLAKVMQVLKTGAKWTG
jgi:uncharacterized protein YdeI (YjbR/CyaY-like superfamily)